MDVGDKAKEKFDYKGILDGTEKRDFCTSCRKYTYYTICERKTRLEICGKNYFFTVPEAFCTECGEEMLPNGIIDALVHAIDAQYRECEGIITIEELNAIMQQYHLTSEKFSCLLGFNQNRIKNYLEGQIPKREDSQRIYDWKRERE